MINEHLKIDSFQIYNFNTNNFLEKTYTYLTL
jgi:hypothetical protein